MAIRSPMPIKFSNLLQTNPQSTVYGLDLSTFSQIEAGQNLFQKLRRKSMHVGTLKSRRAVQGFSPEAESKNIQEIINKSKINRLLIEANFERDNYVPKTSKKRMYVIRKRQDKQRPQQNEKKQELERTRRRSHTEVQQQQKAQQNKPKCNEMFKIKRKIPKFGIEDIAPRISSKRNSFCQQKTASLFMSTSSNSFYNTSFYMNSKIRELQQLKQEKRSLVDQLTPEIKNLVPQPLNRQYALERKRMKQKFYNTNNGFAFTRSKTEEFEPNLVCGWEKWEQEQNQNEGLT